MRGITLVETLIYLAIFALLLASAVAVGTSLAAVATASDEALIDEDDAAFIRAKLAALLDMGRPIEDFDPATLAPSTAVSFHVTRAGTAVEVDGMVGTAAFSVYRSGI